MLDKKRNFESRNISVKELGIWRYCKLILLAFCIAMLSFTGCGKTEKDMTTSFVDNATAEPTVTSEQEEPVELTEEEKKLARLGKQKYQDTRHSVTVLGLKTYKKLKSKKHIDKAEKGKVYLVLFLSIRNDSSERLYFHPDACSAKIDGKETANTILFNEPENYPTIFQNVEAGQQIFGFISWQVPKDWKKLHIEYRGFNTENETLMKMDFTKEDLLTPDEYDPKVYEE